MIHDWVPSDHPYDKNKIEHLKKAVAAAHYKHINGIVVIHDGKLLIEEYFNGAHRDLTHNPRSVGKTFASTMLGIAIADGHIASVEQTLADFYDLRSYDNFHEKKQTVTLKQLLTMSSGFDGFDFDPDSIGNEENMYDRPNWVEWTLNLPMMDGVQPGEKWFYFTAGAVLLGDIIHQSVPGGLEAYAHEKLFKPLNISNYRWQHTPQGVANTAGGIQLTPLDFAKFGYVNKNKGRWGNAQLIPETWIHESFQPYFQTVNANDQYGYLWWQKVYQVGSQAFETYYAGGNGGNKIFVFTEHDLVVVVTASAYGQRYMHSQVDEMMEQFILPVVS